VITADTITDEQIRKLRAEAAYLDGVYRACEAAFGAYHNSFSGASLDDYCAYYRGICADILNARKAVSK